MARKQNEMSVEHTREDEYLFQSPGVRQKVPQHEAVMGQRESSDPGIEGPLFTLYLGSYTYQLHDLGKET